MGKERLRSEINNEYKWDVETVIVDFDKEINELEPLIKKIESFKGIITSSNETLYQFLLEQEKLERKIEKLYVCANMICDTDSTNPNLQNIKIKVQSAYEKTVNRLSFITPEILKLPDKNLKKYIKENNKLNYFKFALEKLYRYKNHTLSEKEEQLISKTTNTFGTGDDVFYNLDNTDIKLGDIILENGDKVQLTNSNYITYMNNKNRNIRIQAFNVMYDYFEGLKNTLATCLKSNIKENFFISDVRKYNSPLEQSLYQDDISIDVYDNLINITNSNLDKLHKYMKLRKDILNVDELHMYDIYVDLINEKEKNISFEEGKKIIIEALKPLGEEYISDLNKAFDNKWIDLYPNKGKKSGAYSWGSYDTKPYLLINYDNNMNSVSTLAHELGHSMHSYYSKEQGPTYHQYPIFLAEIASTVNETLLNDYLYKNAKTDEEKILYLTEMLDKIRTTVFRQTQFAEFEKIIHEKYEGGISLTSEEFSNIYYELNKKYYGKNVVSDEQIKYEWARIPHFYTSFYVYKYATGLTSAIAIATEIISGNKEMKEKYLKFLKSGGSDYPLSILRNTNVDIEDKNTIQKTFDLFDEKYNALKKLYKKKSNTK